MFNCGALGAILASVSHWTYNDIRQKRDKLKELFEVNKKTSTSQLNMITITAHSGKLQQNNDEKNGREKKSALCVCVRNTRLAHDN